jgi:hypothetical protein
MSTSSKTSPKPEVNHERQTSSTVTVFDDNLEEHFKRSLNLHNKQKSHEPENGSISAKVKSEPTSPNQKSKNTFLNSSKPESLSHDQVLNGDVNGNGNLNGSSPGNATSNPHNRTSSWNKRNLPNSFFNKPKSEFTLQRVRILVLGVFFAQFTIFLIFSYFFDTILTHRITPQPIPKFRPRIHT